MAVSGEASRTLSLPCNPACNDDDDDDNDDCGTCGGVGRHVFSSSSASSSSDNGLLRTWFSLRCDGGCTVKFEASFLHEMCFGVDAAVCKLDGASKDWLSSTSASLRSANTAAR